MAVVDAVSHVSKAEELRLTAKTLRARAVVARHGRKFGIVRKVEISPEMAEQLADLCEREAGA